MKPETNSSDLVTSTEWDHDQNIPEEAKSKTPFWDLVDSGAFEAGKVTDIRMLEMYHSLMNEPFA
jgi:hypothetical protein